MPMRRPYGEGLQDQQVERTLQHFAVEWMVRHILILPLTFYRSKGSPNPGKNVLDLQRKLLPSAQCTQTPHPLALFAEPR